MPEGNSPGGATVGKVMCQGGEVPQIRNIKNAGERSEGPESGSTGEKKQENDEWLGETGTHDTYKKLKSNSVAQWKAGKERQTIHSVWWGRLHQKKPGPFKPGNGRSHQFERKVPQQSKGRFKKRITDAKKKLFPGQKRKAEGGQDSEKETKTSIKGGPEASAFWRDLKK